jgi:hypothetical protein
MAIIIEEEKKETNWVGLVSFIAFLAIVFIGGYYLFFKKPELIEVIVPDRLKELKELSNAKFDPETVVNSPTFKVLQDYTQPLAPAEKGRANPFKP